MGRLGLKGGVGDKLQAAEVDKEQLEMGVKVEQEHIKKNKVLSQAQKDSVARDIALDHLAEIPDYYTRLKKMEEEAKKEGKMNPDVEEDEELEKAAIFAPYHTTEHPAKQPMDAPISPMPQMGPRYPAEQSTWPKAKEEMLKKKEKLKVKARRKGHVSD